MTDTGTSCIAGPSRFTDYILETIYDTRKYIFWQGDNSLDCSKKSELPSFDLLFGGYWFRVNVEDYVYQDGDLCYVCIDDSGDERRNQCSAISAVHGQPFPDSNVSLLVCSPAETRRIRRGATER